VPSFEIVSGLHELRSDFASLEGQIALYWKGDLCSKGSEVNLVHFPSQQTKHILPAAKYFPSTGRQLRVCEAKLAGSKGDFASLPRAEGASLC
jgi:hypothetical protein